MCLSVAPRREPCAGLASGVAMVSKRVRYCSAGSASAALANMDVLAPNGVDS